MMDAYKTATKQDKAHIRDFLETSSILGVTKIEPLKARSNTSHHPGGKKTTAYYLREKGTTLTHLLRRKTSSKSVFQIARLTSSMEYNAEGRVRVTRPVGKSGTVRELDLPTKKSFKAVKYLDLNK
jgi:hypothetical protein